MTTLFKSCMQSSIHETLNIINKLKSPVVRSCHIGNNTSNNWGLLALSKNIHLVQYDHTSYGLDENCAPWLVLGDDGIIEKCYDHIGAENIKYSGIHINNYLKSIGNNQYSQFLNYGLFAKYNNTDLINYHYCIANQLSNQINQSNISFDSKEILLMKKTIEAIIRKFIKLRKLHLIFDRWVKKSKKSYIIMQKLGKINYFTNDLIEIYSNNKAKIFSGTIDNLCIQFFESLQSLHNRIIYAKPIDQISYPWLSLKFSYLVSTIKESNINKDQKTFWHAGGSSSQYYINDSNFIKETNYLISILIDNKFLPQDTRINLIPSFCCQLFATNSMSLKILEELIFVWSIYIDKNRRFINNIISLLAKVDHPQNTIKTAFRNIDYKIIFQLKQLMLKFNERDINKLPIAHITNNSSESYNKYGIAQHNLTNEKILVPNNFINLTWGEAELLIKILAEIVINDYG